MFTVPPTTFRESNVYSCVCLLVQVEADLFKCVHLGTAITLTHLSIWGAPAVASGHAQTCLPGEAGCKPSFERPPCFTNGQCVEK